MSEKTYLAVDVGALSGRHVAGLFDGRRLRLEELYRFENGPIRLGDRLYWACWANGRIYATACGPRPAGGDRA